MRASAFARVPPVARALQADLRGPRLDWTLRLRLAQQVAGHTRLAEQPFRKDRVLLGPERYGPVRGCRRRLAPVLGCLSQLTWAACCQLRCLQTTQDGSNDCVINRRTKCMLLEGSTCAIEQR
jgi:hypothetical protein